MAAYAAAVSLMHILDLLKNHPSPPVSLDKQQFDSLTQVVTFLQEFLEGYVSPCSYSDEADPLEMRIAEAVYVAEDVIESYIVDTIHPAANDDDHDDNKHDDDVDYEISFSTLIHYFLTCGCLSLLWLVGRSDDDDAAYAAEDVIESHIVDNIHHAGADADDDDDYDAMESYTVDSIQLAAAATHQEDEQIRYFNFYEGLQNAIEAMGLIKKEAMEMEMTREKGRVVEAELQRNVLADAAFKSSSSEMVGFDDVRLELLARLTRGDSNRKIIPIVGMGGIGKTTLARNIFADKLIEEHFDICVWVTISQDHNIEQTLKEVLSQAKMNSSASSVAGLGEELHKCLFGRRYLIVLDDMWSIEVWDKIRNFFPECNQRSRIIVTTRMSNLAETLSSSSNILCMSFLNQFDSWTLFSKIVFGSEVSVSDLQPDLVEIGEKIVGKCKGLPLSIVVIGGLLARSERTHEYWEYIEKNLTSIVNLDNEEYCLRVLKLSYNHLPVYLKPCFLYMGMFEEDREIKISTVIKLWVSDGFIKPSKKKNLEKVAREYFQELVDRYLLIAVSDDEFKKFELGCFGMTKFCKMHDLIRDLSLREAQNQRFFHVGEEHDPSSHPHRRIVTYAGAYLPRMKLESSPNLRSYVCNGRGFGLLLNFKLLRTLHSQHKYRQDDAFGLVNARLISINLESRLQSSDDYELDSSISRLWSLHTLFVSSLLDLKGPDEFWNMHQLKHVEFTDGGLRLNPPPNNDNNIVILENLHTLIGMRDFYLNEDVVKRIPNLTIFDVRYEKKLVNRKMHCLSYLQRLSKLESFRCRILAESGVKVQRICFPQSLHQIHLDHYNAQWDGLLAKIGRLTFLEDLAIDHGYFKRNKWETTEGQFPKLRNLHLGCEGLKKWIVPEASHFPLLQKIVLVFLDGLEEIPSEVGEIVTLKSIKLIDCNRSAMLSAKKIVQEQEDLYGEEQLSFRVLVGHRKYKKLQRLATPNFQVMRWL